jgi:thioredoxin reductase
MTNALLPLAIRFARTSLLWRSERMFLEHGAFADRDARRHLVMPVVDAILQRSSASTWAQPTCTVPWDLAIVGGGAVGAALTFAARRSGLRVLVLDDADGGGPFAAWGAAFRLNTAIDAAAPDEHPGLALPLSVLTGARFASGQVLGELVRLTLAQAVEEAGRVDVLLRARVVSRVGTTLTVEKDGQERSFSAQRVLVVPGMGAPTSTLPLSERVDHAPTYAQQWLAGAHHEDDVVVLAGRGPTALAVVSLWTGIADSSAFDDDGRCVRPPHGPRVQWVSGADDVDSVAQIAAELQQGLPSLAVGAATLMAELQRLEACGALVVVPGRVVAVADVDTGVAVDVRCAEHTQVLHAARVVLATGLAPDRSLQGPTANEIVVDDDGCALVVGEQWDEHVYATGAVLEHTVAPRVDRGPLADHVDRALRVLPLVLPPSSLQRPMPAAVVPPAWGPTQLTPCAPATFALDVVVAAALAGVDVPAHIDVDEPAPVWTALPERARAYVRACGPQRV